MGILGLPGWYFLVRFFFGFGIGAPKEKPRECEALCGYEKAARRRPRCCQGLHIRPREHEELLRLAKYMIFNRLCQHAAKRLTVL